MRKKFVSLLLVMVLFLMPMHMLADEYAQEYAEEYGMHELLFEEHVIAVDFEYELKPCVVCLLDGGGYMGITPFCNRTPAPALCPYAPFIHNWGTTIFIWCRTTGPDTRHCYHRYYRRTRICSRCNWHCQPCSRQTSRPHRFVETGINMSVRCSDCGFTMPI